MVGNAKNGESCNVKKKRKKACLTWACPPPFANPSVKVRPATSSETFGAKLVTSRIYGLMTSCMWVCLGFNLGGEKKKISRLSHFLLCLFCTPTFREQGCQYLQERFTMCNTFSDDKSINAEGDDKKVSMKNKWGQKRVWAPHDGWSVYRHVCKCKLKHTPAFIIYTWSGVVWLAVLSFSCTDSNLFAFRPAERHRLA